MQEQLKILVTSFAVLFMIVPPFVRALLAIRRHNAQLGDAVTLQMSIVLQREKRVALDMCIVAGLLFTSLSPGLSMSTVQKPYPRLHSNDVYSVRCESTHLLCT